MELTQFRNALFTEGEKMGFSNLELSYEKQDNFSCEVFKGEVDGYQSSSVQGVSIRGMYDGRTGYAYTEKITADSIEFLLENAKENASLSETEPETLFSGAASYEKVELYSPLLDEVTIAEKIAFIKEVEKKVYDADTRVIQADYAAIRNETTEKALFNSKGLALNEHNNFLSVFVSVLVKENGEVKSAYHYETTKDFTSLDADRIAKKSCRESVELSGSEKLSEQNVSSHSKTHCGCFTSGNVCLLVLSRNGAV
ncbi:DNA gyrase modulator [Virgibacillus halophilus]|uniref:DNA gyrase modulator n=1 Tax=Tigheibacillus halophilus TaxID=361280 RepID=A0ABU5C9V9_9BACI|nr:DNA gyrase modulator [Virgibacillus halophilus]